MKTFGKILFGIGILATLGTIAIDDSEVTRGMNPTFESLLIKILFGMSLVASGIILMKKERKHGTGKEL